MTVKIADHVFETTTITGAGTYSLAGPVTGFRSFVAATATGALVPYYVDQRDGSGAIVAWESGIGTITAGVPDTLARTKILASSNANAAVNWGVGTKNVRLAAVAAIALTRDEKGNFVEGFGTLAGTGNAITITYPATVANTVPTAYSDGMLISGFITAPNTGPVTVNLQALGAKALTANGTALAAGALPLGAYFEGRYRLSTDEFLLIEPVNSAAFATTAQGLAAVAALAGQAGRITNGLVLSNNATDSANDIDIAAGSGVADDGTILLTGAAMTKQVDAAWAAGNNAGGLDTGAVANTTYHLYMISKADGSAVDYIYTATLGAPTMPATYTKKVYIGSIVRASASNFQFFQIKDEFYLKTRVVEVADGSSGTTAKTLTLANIPNGIKCKAFLRTYVTANGTGIIVSSLDSVDVGLSGGLMDVYSSSAAGLSGSVDVWTNATKQVRYRTSVNDNISIGIVGYRNPLLKL